MLVQLVNLVRIYFLDNDHHKSHCEIRFAPVVDLAVLLGLLPTWAGLIAPLSSAVCTGVDLIVQHKDTSPSGAAPGSTVKRGAAFFFTTAGENDHTIRIPALKPEYYEQTGPFAGIRVDLANSDIFNFTDFVLRGDRTTAPVDIWENDLETVVGGIREDF